jgi:hypothetical protein
MKIIRESCSVDASDPGFVHILHVRIKDTGADRGGQMWFERQNLPWVVDTLRSCLTVYAFPRTTVDSGHDSLKIFESGDEQAPIINLVNSRSDGAPHAGVYALLMSKPIAEKLLIDLSAI